jgi:alpha-beta hydrolase superfamily lysophospholipase
MLTSHDEQREAEVGFEHAEFRDSPTGARLALRRQPAMAEARGIVLVNHGLAEHSARYAPFAQSLSERGYHVFAQDHRGHGATMAKDAPLGRFAASDGVASVIADVLAVQAHATALYPGLPVILFGHSMGGLIAANVAERQPQAFSGLAIWNSHLNPGLLGRVGLVLLKAERFLKGSDVPSSIAPRLTFDAWGKSVPGAKTVFDWLSRDPAVVQAYIDDPLCGFDISVSMWIDVTTMALEGGARRNLARLPKTLPVHITGGSEDPATDGGKAMAWLDGELEAAGLISHTLSINQGMRHETLNEIGREQAISGFIDWCDRVTSLFR